METRAWHRPLSVASSSRGATWQSPPWLTRCRRGPHTGQRSTRAGAERGRQQISRRGLVMASAEVIGAV